MGTTNVSCVFTGLEITEGDDVFAALVSTQAIPYEGHPIHTPPLRGTYDAYGAITLTEDVPCLGLQKGATWPSDDASDDTLAPVFVHPAIFEALETTPCTHNDGETFGQRAMRHVEDLRQKLTDPIVAERIGRITSDTEDPDFMRRCVIAMALKGYERGLWDEGPLTFAEAYNQPEAWPSAFDLAGRAYLLRRAEGMLRRPLVPVNWGPNEADSGARARILSLAATLAHTKAEHE